MQDTGSARRIGDGYMEELGRVAAERPVVVGDSGGRAGGVKRSSNANGNRMLLLLSDASNLFLFQFQQEEKQKESNLTKAVSCLAW